MSCKRTGGRGIFPPVQFEKINARQWRAKDKADVYEVIESNGKTGRIFACFKNRTIYFATEDSLESAIARCGAEQQTQEWQSNNPENKAKNAEHRKARSESKVKRPVEQTPAKPLYTGE